MEREGSTGKNPWSTLSTVTTFDTGNNTTLRINNVQLSSNEKQVVRRVNSSSSLLIISLIQQICTIFEGDTVRRKKLFSIICDEFYKLKLIDGSYTKAEYESLRGEYQKALYQLVNVARAVTGSENALRLPSLTTEWSRYRREFQEIGFIARGGFGDVFKAIHRLDGTEYAIKKIEVRSGRLRSIMQHLEEVKTLARLNHANIVPYKSAWIEPSLPSIFLPTLPAPTTGSLNSREIIQRGLSSAEIVSQRMNSISSKEIHQENESHAHKLRVYEESNSDVVSFRSDSKNIGNERNSGNISGNNSENNSTSRSSNSFSESVNNREILSYNSRMTPQNYATLYIQMALCDKTLKMWLDERNDFTCQSTIRTILKQILLGLEYIHSEKMVHHDIKPSNIFISSSKPLRIHLGDFGLACPLQRENHRSIIGTHMYSAPEQLEGKCDPKSDVYSVGIVLVELLLKTNTHMELQRTITSIKSGKFPEELSNHPEWARLVNRMLDKDPRKRPSTGEILTELSEDKDLIIAELKSTNAAKDDEIKNLQRELSSLKEKLWSLEERLKNCDTPLGNT